MDCMYLPRRCRRGSVLILVVAVLALLVLMGTAYIVSARTDRANATAMSAANNVDLARDAVMAQVQQVIGSAMIDANGQVGGYATAGNYGTTAARNYDYPELGTTFGQTNINAGMRDEPWLVKTLHNTTPVNGKDMSQLTAFPFNVQTGAYDGQNGVTFPSTISTTNAFNVVNDLTQTDGPGDTEDPANPSGSNPVALKSDSYINLLPFSDASGVRYRFGVRILDSNRMANLMTGCPVDATVWNAGAATPTDISGAYPASLRLAPASGWPSGNSYFQADTGSFLHNDTVKNLGRVTTGFTDTSFSTQVSALSYTTPSVITLPSVYTWQKQMFLIEGPDPKNLGTSDSVNRQHVVPFDMSDELELRSYGEFGTSYTARPAVTSIWPSTLGNLPVSTVKGNKSRRDYTTYSFSRDIRALVDPAVIYTITPLPGNAVSAWPALPARVAANPLVDITTNNTTNDTNNAMEYVAMAATNLATVIEGCGFPHEDAVAFAANYMTQRWNGFCVDSTGGYTLPNGPSFVDDKGVCFRTAKWMGTAASPGTVTTAQQDFTGTLNAPAGTVYLGYAAQPFLNEVAEFEDTNSGTPNYTDTAVELYNPYPVPLSLTGYHLFIGALDIPLAGFVPANGYYVMTGANGRFGGKVTNSVTVQTAVYSSLALSQATTSIVLCRPYCARGTATSLPSPPPDLAAVDTMDVTKLIDPTGLPDEASGGVMTEETVERTNTNTNLPGANYWGASIYLTSALTTRTTQPTLGNPNTPFSTNSPIVGYPLADRFAQIDSANADVSAIQLSPMGMGEFSRTIRLANEFTPPATAGSAPVPVNTVSMHLAAIEASGLTEDKIRFDFRADPSVYNSSPPTDSPSVKLLGEIAMVDRVSDYSNAVNGIVGFDIQKIRLPGLINVNTASGDVLRAIPNMTDQMVANILAYRSRQASITYNGMASTTDYSVVATYPGLGIRSLAELLVPLAGLTPARQLNPAQYFSASMDSRDQAWGSIYNLCSVRSDTFVVYGYLEAVKPNPADNAFNNNTNWYGTGAANVSDDPHAASTVPLIRLGRRRWVAIVDRSFCNYGAADAKYSIPRVVAIKDLPQ